VRVPLIHAVVRFTKATQKEIINIARYLHILRIARASALLPSQQTAIDSFPPTLDRTERTAQRVMFNSAAYSAGSNRRTAPDPRWVTAEPVTYGLGYTSQAPPPPDPPTARNRDADFHGDSPAPANPLQQLFAPLDSQVTPDISRRRAGGAHRAAPRDEVSGIVSTPPASTIRRPAARQQVVSPTADSDDRIADRLANLWTEYVDKPHQPPTSDKHRTLVSEREEITTTTTTVEGTWMNPSYLHPTKRWMYRHVQTPEAGSAYPHHAEALHRGGVAGRGSIFPAAVETRSSSAWAASSIPSGRPVDARVTPPPTPYLGASTSTYGGGTASQDVMYPRHQGDALPTYQLPHGLHAGWSGTAPPLASALQFAPSAYSAPPAHSAMSSVTTYPLTTFAGAPASSSAYPQLSPRGEPAAETIRFGLQSPVSFPAHWQSQVPAHQPTFAAVQGDGYDSMPAQLAAAQSYANPQQRGYLLTQPYPYNSPPISSGVLEAIRTLEERERGQRDHVRFVEAQSRRNLSTRASLEKPYGLAARPLTQPTHHDALPSREVATSTAYLWTSNHEPLPNPSFHLPPVHQVPQASQHSIVDDERYRKMMSQHAASVVDHQERVDSRAHTSLHHPPRSVSPLRRAPFLFERIAHIKDDELRGRHDLEMAEYQVRDAVCSVISSLQRHADAAAAQQALHRSLLITVSDEQDGRKQIEALQEHIVGAIVHLYGEATQSLVTTAYERISFFTRLYGKMHSDESRQRLDVVDEEVLSRRSVMVALHEAELSLYYTAAARLNECHRAVQRVAGHEAELRFGILQQEDHVRNEKFTRWSHERSVLDHVERQRLSSSRIIFSKLRHLQEQEHALRIDAEETQLRMHATLVAYSESAYERHRQIQQQSIERHWRDSQQREFAGRIAELEDREQTLRREGVMAWECVVEALHEWQAEMALQQELEMQFQHKRKLVGHIQQLEDIERSTRAAIAFAEDAVHTQHVAWAREMAVSLREARASAMARLMHALGASETFTRNQIAEEGARSFTHLCQREHAAYTILLIHYCIQEEDEGRETLAWLERQALAVLVQHESTERQAHTDREFRAACRRHEFRAMVDAYHTAEADSRHGLTQTEADQRDSMLAQRHREMRWIVEHVEARRRAAEEARRELTQKEHAAREERMAAEVQEWFDLGRSEEVGHRRAVEAASAAQRQREYQLRASSMTLCRLEEVNREVIVGAAAKSFQSLEERQSMVWKKYEEEHHRLQLVMEERKLRTFDEKRRRLFDDEAVAREGLNDVAHDMSRSLFEQFELRRPLAQSDNPAVVQFLHAEHRGRLELEDLFTYERWNLADLEAMSRDDVADGVAPLSLPRNDDRSLPRSHLPHSEERHDVFSVVSGNDFAQFVEASFPQPPSAPPPPQPPHPTSWEYEDLSPPREYEHAATQQAINPALPVTLPTGLESLRPKPPSRAPVTKPVSDVQQALLHMRPSTSIGGSGASTPTERLPGGGPGSIPIPDALRAMLRPGSAPQLPRTMPPPPRTVPSVRGSPPRPPPSAPSVGNMSRGVQDQLSADLLTQEATVRKKLATAQYQQLAAIIQENIETLPEA
jgi:hypothetical protein